MHIWTWMAAVALFVVGGAAVAVGLAAWQIGQAHHILERVVRMSVQDAVDTIVAQLAKAKVEILGALDDARAQVEAAGVPAEQVDLSALEAIAQGLDDIVPDAVADEPELVVELPPVVDVELPEPVVEPEPELVEVVEDVAVVDEDAADPTV